MAMLVSKYMTYGMNFVPRVNATIPRPSTKMGSLRHAARGFSKSFVNIIHSQAVASHVRNSAFTRLLSTGMYSNP